MRKSDKFTCMESACFWMGGRLATDLIEITNDPSDIDDGFWAITTTFDGQFTAAKFSDVIESKWELPYSPLRGSGWNSSHTKASYCQLVEDFRHEISLGNVYQVNACRVLTLETNQSIEGLIAGFLEQNPASHLGYLRISELEIASASPETFLKRDGELISSSPIKGTRKPGLTGRFPEKDESENIMIVDLMRNDLGRVCIEDSISVPRLLAIDELPGLTQIGRAHV